MPLKTASKAASGADADAVVATVYGGDQGKADAVVNKSWSYFKRAHLHTGALGTEAFALTLLMVLLVNAPRRGRVFAATTAALGGLGYGWFWFFAGMAAPGLGSTDAAKESMAFLALPAAAAVVVGTVTALMMIVIAWRRSSDEGGGTSPGA